MPNRIIRPWTDSEAVNAVSEQAEVFFVRLIMCADDFGRFHGDPRLLKSYLYPLKDKRVADISRLITECVKAGLIADYEVSGKRYVVIRNFKQQTRIQKSKFPPPPDGCLSNAQQMHSKCLADEQQMRTRDGDGDVMKSSLCSDFSPKRSGRRITFGYDEDNEIHGISEKDMVEWRKFYPALDVEQEIRSASAWLKGNPKNRKKDILRFLTNWLNRAQERTRRIETRRQGNAIDTRVITNDPSKFDQADDGSNI